MLPDPARRFSISPSRPDVQRKRNETIAQTKNARAARKLDKVTTPKTRPCTTMKPDDPRGFSEMWRAFQNAAGHLLDGLDAEDAAKVHAVAWRHYHALEHTSEWHNIVMALTERQRVNQPVQSVKRWRSGTFHTTIPDGW